MLPERAGNDRSLLILRESERLRQQLGAVGLVASTALWEPCGNGAVAVFATEE